MMSKKCSIVFNNEIITYDNLLSRVSLIGSILKNHDTNISNLGIAIHRSPDLISAIFAAIELKIPFIPIDVNLPIDRLNLLFETANITTIISENNINLELKDFNKVCNADTNFVMLQKAGVQQQYNDVMYTIFTSGSTGAPKGVEILHESFANLVNGITTSIDFSSLTCMPCFAASSFDMFFLESIVALQEGLKVILANEEERYNPKLMAKLIHNNAVDIIQMTPSRMQMLLNYDKELTCLKNVKVILVGGEPFPANLLKALQKNTTAKIYNMYGPTEATIWSTISDLTHKDCIDIGRPMQNTEVYIVDDNGFIIPDGEEGEIGIAGKGLAKGYVGRDDLTAEKFIFLPQKPEVRVYLTGDMGRYLPDGNLEYLGRKDNQVKICGYRIEPEEIEAYLNQIEGIKQSMVIVVDKNEIGKSLEAFYTSDNNVEIKVISDYLATKLPSYMIPANFKRIKEFFYTRNGKIDRSRVLECVEIEPNMEKFPVISNDILSDTQRKIFEIILSNFEDRTTTTISLDSSFSNIGFDSVSFIKTIVDLEEALDFEFDDEMLIISKFPTIRSMIEYVETKI